MSLTRVQQQILHAVLERADYQLMSLFRLATELEIDYKHARWCVQDLARRGLVKVSRPHGRDMRVGVFGPWDYQDQQSSMGPVSTNSTSIVHRSKSGGVNTMSNIVDTLRAALQQDGGYQRPELSPAQQASLSRAARRVNAIRDDALRLSYVAALVYENARLLAECNEHRCARGFDPLPVHDPDKAAKK